MSDNRRQIRIRVPTDLLAELEASGNLNDQIVAQLRLAKLSRKTLTENAMVRALALCFASAEVITGKSVEDDTLTLRLALEMTSKMVTFFEEQVKGNVKTKPGLAQKVLQQLLKVASIEDDKRQTFLAGLAAASPV